MPLNSSSQNQPVTFFFLMQKKAELKSHQVSRHNYQCRKKPKDRGTCSKSLEDAINKLELERPSRG